MPRKIYMKGDAYKVKGKSQKYTTLEEAEKAAGVVRQVTPTATAAEAFKAAEQTVSEQAQEDAWKKVVDACPTCGRDDCECELGECDCDPIDEPTHDNNWLQNITYIETDIQLTQFHTLPVKELNSL